MKSAPVVYFLPGAPAQPSDLHEWGLGHIGEPVSFRQCSNGPGGSGGTLAAVGEKPAYLPAGQTWTQAPSSFAPRPWWVGFAPDVKPEHLARADQRPGVHVTLADGNSWLIPQLREYHETPGEEIPVAYFDRLPRLITIDDDGDYAYGDVVKPLRSIWKRSVEIWEQLFGMVAEDGAGGISQRELITFAIDCLALNYRIGPVEVSALRLFATPTAEEVVRIALDVVGFERIWKQIADSTESAGGEPSAREVEPMAADS